ncbi:MAG: hypothetical protein NWE89_14320 [Candidatus Bathyarchaeota archaeon]|nr:hypothetical protein [Candidatus Bathyarchaeota archaeon]
MEKQLSFHHSVTEVATIQIRLVGAYIKDGEERGRKYLSGPMTPADKVIEAEGAIVEMGEVDSIEMKEVAPVVYDPAKDKPVEKNLDGWDDRTCEIVGVITDPDVYADFVIEKQGVMVDGVMYIHPSLITGEGMEETMSFDRELWPDGRIPIRRIHRIFEDGREDLKEYHRTWIMPGDDPSGADVMSKALAIKLHTLKVVKDYKAKLAAQALLNR